MREKACIFGACGELVGIRILFILINSMGADFNITIRYLGDFLFSKKNWVFSPTFSKIRPAFFKITQKYSAGYYSRHQSRNQRLALARTQHGHGHARHTAEWRSG
jgi:hypothetical protein